jgi:lipoate-protein ligase A
MQYELLDLKPRNPYLSLAIDEAIARYFGRESGRTFRALIRLWANPATIVLGRTCSAVKNVSPEYLERFRVRFRHNGEFPFLCRRTSGGGTVLHGPGNINYSIFLNMREFPELFDIKRSYRFFLGLVQMALRAQDIESVMEGLSDLAVIGPDGVKRKISGNAQFRKHGIIMHHGTLITRKNLISSISQFLNHPPVEPEYRKGRNHEEFLGSLPDGFDLTAFRNCLSGEMKRFLGVSDLDALSGSDIRLVLKIARGMVKDLYAKSGWILEGRMDSHAKGGLYGGGGMSPNLRPADEGQ